MFMSVVVDVVNPLIIIMYLYYCSHFSLSPSDVPCEKDICIVYVITYICIVYVINFIYPPKCFGNTLQRYGHANKASFGFELNLERERERERGLFTLEAYLVTHFTSLCCSNIGL